MDRSEQIVALRKKLDYLFPKPSMTPDEVRERYDDLPIIEPENELPGVYAAFFKEALENYGSDNEVCEFFIYSLCPTKEWESAMPYYERRFGVFTEEQMAVFFSFLEIVKCDPDFALIWGQVKRSPDRLRNIWNIIKSNKRL